MSWSCFLKKKKKIHCNGFMELHRKKKRKKNSPDPEYIAPQFYNTHASLGQGNPCKGTVSDLELFSLNFMYCAGQ